MTFTTIALIVFFIFTIGFWFELFGLVFSWLIETTLDLFGALYEALAPYFKKKD